MNQQQASFNHQELLRLLAFLFVYIGLADDTGDALRSFRSFVFRPHLDRNMNRDWAAPSGDCMARAFRALRDPATVPRRLHRKIVELLRPVEAATRRLIVALASTLLRPKLPALAFEYVSFVGGEQEPAVTREAEPEIEGDGEATPEPESERAPRFALLDPLPPLRNGPSHPFPVGGFVADPEAASDPINDASLMRRIAALAAALDDLPAQARRFARWWGRMERGRTERQSPLRRGRAPGAAVPSLPKSRWRDWHHVLDTTHQMALEAWRYPDTS